VYDLVAGMMNFGEIRNFPWKPWANFKGFINQNNEKYRASQMGKLFVHSSPQLRIEKQHFNDFLPFSFLLFI
jgi:hypothetical protein